MHAETAHAEEALPALRPVVTSPAPTNGLGSPEHGVDPAVLLLVGEVRRSNDALRAEMVSALRDVAGEVQELRRQAPGRLALYALGAVVVLALVAQLALVATRGVDPGKVVEAVQQVTPLP